MLNQEKKSSPAEDASTSLLSRALQFPLEVEEDSQLILVNSYEDQKAESINTIMAFFKKNKFAGKAHTDSRKWVKGTLECILSGAE